MDFRILGPLEVADQGRLVAIPSAKQRALLAMLLLHANEVVSTDRLIEALWSEEPPATALATLQVHMSRLRRILDGGSVMTRAPGYLLAVTPERCDLGRFETMHADGRTALES